MNARNIFTLSALFVIALGAAFLRFRGIDWDQGHLLHPDERFLVMVQGAVALPSSLSEYFDTESSPFNPHNRGHGFYVYGTFPLLLARLFGNILSPDLIPPHLIGRAISAAADLGTVALAGLIALRLSGPVAGLLAALLVAGCALHIQHAHFGTVDALGTFLATAAVSCSIRISKLNPSGSWRANIALCGLCGLVIGLAAATKINLVLVAIVLPLALFIAKYPVRSSALSLFVTAMAATVTFRVFQPYAFIGPGFLDLTPNPKWLANLAEVRRLAVPSLGFPPAVQWIDRELWFGLYNMVVWGLGLPLGLLSITALGWALFTLAPTRRSPLLLPISWCLVGLLVFGVFTQNVTLRYLLPIYPSLLILTAIAAYSWWTQAMRSAIARLAIRAALGSCITAGVLWGYALSSVYVRPHSRIAASEWIVDQIPSAVNLGASAAGFRHTIPVMLREDETINPGQSTNLSFSPSEDIRAEFVLLPHIRLGNSPPDGAQLGLISRSIGKVSIQRGTDILAEALLEATSDGRSAIGTLAPSVDIQRSDALTLRISNLTNQSLTIRLPRIAHETDWDDGLPLRVRGLDPYGGMYHGAEKIQAYWPDNEEKKERIKRTLDEADYLVMTSNRQWGSVGRLEREFPLMNEFYRALAGCKEQDSVPECYAHLTETDPPGSLNFRLIKTFTSYPSVFGFEIPDQTAEEAFTVYDHPKVHLFAKVH
jgi:hypothetical protein